MTEYWLTYQECEAEGWPEWAAVTSIDEMSELVIDWLQRKTPVLPWHAGPPDDETSLIRSQLVALNRVTGIVTVNSQPGLETARWRQRAWVSGYATPETLTDLTDRARKQSLAVQTVAQIAPDDPIIAEPVSIRQGHFTNARAQPSSQLPLPEPARMVLERRSSPFSIYVPEWNTNRMWTWLNKGQ